MTTDAPRPLRIAVIGQGHGASPELEAIAETVGRVLAEAGAVVITGGKGGVMLGASRGAARAGGLTIGLLPDSDASQANPWVGVPIATGVGYARNAIVARSADAVVAIAGAYGTLSEIGFALNAGTPVVGLGTWRLIGADGEPDTAIEYVDDPEVAAQRAVALARHVRS